MILFTNNNYKCSFKNALKPLMNAINIKKLLI